MITDGDPAPADPLATALEEIRGRERAATKGPWRVTRGAPGVETAWEVPEGYARAGSALPVASMVLTVGKAEREAANARFTAGARSDVPRLLAAVEWVIAHHEPEDLAVYTSCGAHVITGPSGRDPLRFDKMADCPDCERRYIKVCSRCDEDDAYPCRTVQAITRALLGEEARSGRP